MNFFFFYKRISDLDHLTPIIFCLIKNKIDTKKIFVFNLEPDKTLLDLHQDPRVKFLRSLGLNIEVSTLKQFYLKYLEKVINPSRFNLPLKLIRRLFYLKVLQGFLRKIFILRLRSKLKAINFFKSDLFILDHSTSSSHLEVIRIAKRKKLKIISVPHGLITHEGLLNNEHNKMLFKENKLMNEFDKVIFSNDAELKRSQIDEEKRLVLGSARFSREWHEQLKSIYKSVNIRKDNKINILLLAEKDGRQIGDQFIPDIYPEKITEVVNLLSSDKHVNLIIKHHPSRTGQFGTEDYGPYSCKNAIHIFKDSKASTFQLTQESDLILTTFSSAAIDAFLLKKRVLVLEFASPYKLVYRRFPGIKKISNIEDLIKIISNLEISNLDDYSLNYREFIDEFVEKDNQNLKNYYNFLTSLNTE